MHLISDVYTYIGIISLISIRSIVINNFNIESPDFLDHNCQAPCKKKLEMVTDVLLRFQKRITEVSIKNLHKVQNTSVYGAQLYFWQ